LVSSINSLLSAGLLGNSGGSTFGVDADLLTSWAASKAGIGVSVPNATADPKGPIAPVWTPGYTPGAEALIARAVAGKGFFDTSAKLYSDLGATGDYKRLFALHTGISTLQALAARAQDENLSKALRKQTEAEFARGLSELQQFFGEQQFEDVRLAQGDRVDSAQSTLALASTSEDYTTGIVQKGSLYGAMTGLDANARFDIVALSSAGTERRVEIDLSQMGSIPRSLGNVVAFINNKLSAAAVATRLATVDQTPKTTKMVFGGKTIETKYTGARQYALKVDVRGFERVSFEPVNPDPAFYVVGQVNGGARLIKLENVGDEAGQPTILQRPGVTSDPTGAYVSTGWYGPGAPYNAAPAGAYEQRSNVLESVGKNNFEDALAEAGEAKLTFTLADGRTVSVSTAWQSKGRENWRVRAGETEERARLDDLAERLTQLLHEQGVAAGVDVWRDGTDSGLSVFTADGVKASSFSISGKAVSLANIDPPNMVGGLREGVFARRFEAGAVAADTDLFIGKQSFVISASGQTKTFTIDGKTAGFDAATLIEKLNEKIHEAGLAAAASFANNGGALSLRIDGLHDLTAVSATLNEDEFDAELQAPGPWVNGGLPVTSAGQPFADALRTTSIAGSPLQTYNADVTLQIVVSTPAGDKTVSVQVSALERANDPDGAPGEWSAAFQDRLNEALNQAGVYVSASSDLTTWTTAEGVGQRIKSVSINGDAQTLTASAPSFSLGGAFSAERSFTSGQAAGAVDEDIAALQGDQTVSITFGTIWGEKTVSASLQMGDPPTLESAALRLNEALATAGYDLGVAATDLSGGGAGLRIVSGASHSIRGDVSLSLGGTNVGTTLDGIDSSSADDDPVTALGVAARASRGAAVTESVLSQSTLSAPSAASAAWFPGRAFDVSISGGASVATARAVATGADGAVYVLADLDGDSATMPIKGARDVALLKYDSAGNLAYTRVLGASDSASGFALAVSSDGKVAVGGSVEGGLAGAGAEKGGTDSFVSVYDADGDQLWTARRAATGNDQVNALAFASNGTLVVAGRTESALGSTLALGGSDGYVKAFSASGGELFTRQFGTGKDDTATALLVRDNGSGGVDIFTGGVEDNVGTVRRFSYAPNSGLSVGATRSLGNFYKGAINALAIDGASLYVGGEIGADRLTVGAIARTAVANQEGFVARIDAGLVSTALDRASYIGSAQDDSVSGLAVVNGEVYASGVAGGLIAGQGTAKMSGGYLARLDDAGEIAWARTFSSAAGTVRPAAMAVDASGASPLDVLGLPRGLIDTRNSNALADRSALRVGDEFRIGADGRSLSTIKIAEKDTLSSLAGKIARSMGAAGRVKIVKEDGRERLEITPTDGRAVRIEAGREGKDALPGLGLGAGIIATNGAKRGALKNYGLGLIAADLKLASAGDIAKAKAELSAAISIVRQAYDALLHPNAKAQTDEEKALQARRDAAGRAPDYYSQQLSNYKAALARLGG
jgi:WD40 repeat protein